MLRLTLLLLYFFVGVATAFAARDILGNVLSGLSMQFSKPFSLGDTIKVSKACHIIDGDYNLFILTRKKSF